VLTAEGGQWRPQRLVIAPMFARKTVMDFTPAMMGAAEVLIKRWSGVGDHATIDVAAELAMATRRWSNARFSRMGLDPTPKTSGPPW
jgi:cytochrome P450